MIRLAPLLAALLLVCGCGEGDTKTTTATTTAGASSTERGDTSGAKNAPGPSSLAGSGGAPAGERIHTGKVLSFHTPSGRIGCVYTKDPTTLRCDTAFPTRFSETGHRCEHGDYGQAFMLHRNGPARAICASDTILSGTDARSIPYDRTWLLGPFSCRSQRTGLSCRNPGGHGLSLAVEAQKVF